MCHRCVTANTCETITEFTWNASKHTTSMHSTGVVKYARKADIERERNSLHRQTLGKTDIQSSSLHSHHPLGHEVGVHLQVQEWAEGIKVSQCSSRMLVQ